MRCQYCGKRLPILRKLTDGEFCSPAHRRSFQEEQERQALSRLLEASQMGASRRAQEVRPQAAAAVPGKEVAAGRVGKKIPELCTQLFPLSPQERRECGNSEGPRTLPLLQELLLTDELARRTSPRIQRRLRGAGLSRHYGPEPLAPTRATPALAAARYAARALTAELGPLAARQIPTKSPRLRSSGRRPVRVAPRRAGPEPGQFSFGRLPAQGESACFPSLRVTTDWTPPRLLNATRLAEAVNFSLAAAHMVLPLRGSDTACPAPGQKRMGAQIPLRRLTLPNGTPARAGLRPASIGEARGHGTLQLAYWEAPAAHLARPSAELAWRRPSLGTPAGLPVSQRLRRLPLNIGATLPASLAAANTVHAIRWNASPVGPGRRAEVGNRNSIRGSWLVGLPQPGALPPRDLALNVAQTPVPLGKRRPMPPPGKLAAPTPGALDRLVSMPGRYRPEPRVMADRGRMLFLAVMAKPIALDTPLAAPKRKKLEARAVKVTAGAVAAFHAASMAPADIVAVAQRPVALLPNASDEIELKARGSQLPGPMPKQYRRMVRWIPTLPLSVEGAGLAQLEQNWHNVHLKALPPRVVFHPDAARTKRRSLVPDALRQTFARTPAGRTWRLAPPDLRWVAMAAPVVIGLAWWSLAPKARPSDETMAAEVRTEVQAPEPTATATATAKRKALPARALAAKASPAETPPAAAEAPPEAGFLETYFGPLEAKIRARAAVEVSDDFRSGLSAWEGDRGWSEGWSYDQAGFVLPGGLALLRPTTGLTDYTFEFLGMIESKALSWVFRAKDTRNYYAGKLVVVQGGPLPVIAFVRYRVVNGREEGRKVVMLHESVRTETLYRVKIDVNGNDFTTSVLGKIVDTFSDAVHPQGGVGLFSARGEQAKIRWVEVSHQYDSIGRLCAFLAPPRLERQPEERLVVGKKSAPKKRGS